MFPCDKILNIWDRIGLYFKLLTLLHNFALSTACQMLLIKSWKMLSGTPEIASEYTFLPCDSSLLQYLLQKSANILLSNPTVNFWLKTLHMVSVETVSHFRILCYKQHQQFQVQYHQQSHHQLRLLSIHSWQIKKVESKI